MNKVAALVFFAAGIGLVAFAMVRRSAEDNATGKQVAAPGTHIDDFVLTDRTGLPFSSADLQGKVWVASFFFSSCPTTCLRQNQTVAALADEFASQGVKFVSITCDPENDTPQNLQAYAARFHAKPDEWYFLTGDLTYIRMIGRDAFQVLVEKQTHSNRLMLVDKWGNVRGKYNWEDPKELETLKKNIAKLMAETTPPAKSNDS